jgi:hypothetical protein
MPRPQAGGRGIKRSTVNGVIIWMDDVTDISDITGQLFRSYLVDIPDPLAGLSEKSFSIGQ